MQLAEDTASGVDLKNIARKMHTDILVLNTKLAALGPQIEPADLTIWRAFRDGFSQWFGTTKDATWSLISTANVLQRYAQTLAIYHKRYDALSPVVPPAAPGSGPNLLLIGGLLAAGGFAYYKAKDVFSVGGLAKRALSGIGEELEEHLGTDTFAKSGMAGRFAKEALTLVRKGNIRDATHALEMAQEFVRGVRSTAARDSANAVIDVAAKALRKLQANKRGGLAGLMGGDDDDANNDNDKSPAFYAGRGAPRTSKDAQKAAQSLFERAQQKFEEAIATRNVAAAESYLDISKELAADLGKKQRSAATRMLRSMARAIEKAANQLHADSLRLERDALAARPGLQKTGRKGRKKGKGELGDYMDDEIDAQLGLTNGRLPPMEFEEFEVPDDDDDDDEDDEGEGFGDKSPIERLYDQHQAMLRQYGIIPSD